MASLLTRSPVVVVLQKRMVIVQDSEVTLVYKITGFLAAITCGSLLIVLLIISLITLASSSFPVKEKVIITLFSLLVNVQLMMFDERIFPFGMMTSAPSSVVSVLARNPISLTLPARSE